MNDISLDVIVCLHDEFGLGVPKQVELVRRVADGTTTWVVGIECACDISHDFIALLELELHLFQIDL